MFSQCRVLYIYCLHVFMKSTLYGEIKHLISNLSLNTDIVISARVLCFYSLCYISGSWCHKRTVHMWTDSIRHIASTILLTVQGFTATMECCHNRLVCCFVDKYTNIAKLVQILQSKTVILLTIDSQIIVIMWLNLNSLITREKEKCNWMRRKNNAVCKYNIKYEKHSFQSNQSVKYCVQKHYNTSDMFSLRVPSLQQMLSGNS